MQMRLRSQSKGSDAMRRRCEEEKALWGKANKDRIQVKASATGQGIHILFDRERSLLPYDSDSDLSSSNGSAVSPANSSTKASTKSSTRSSVSLSTRAPTRMRARPPTRASTRASTIASLKAAAKRTPPQTPRANTPYEPTSALRTPRKLQRHERIGGGTGVTARILDSSIASEGTLLFAGNGPSPLSAIVLSPAAQAVAAATARRARTTRATEAGRGRISTSPDPFIDNESASDVASEGIRAPTESASNNNFEYVDMNFGGRVFTQRMEMKGSHGTLVLDEFTDARAWGKMGFVVDIEGKMQTIQETIE
ncbi:hypothetical protein OF83DRAFT_1281171 [Amylostereum chailletii]|nr:hypothetical protein OF83DRAFT_1281171 [Amylostereum chailletii]